jgi:hypothetical protein
MMDEHTAWLPPHRTIVTGDNIDAMRRIMPEDQREAITVGCMIWRCPSDVDTWTEPCGSTLSYWPDTQRGALHHDGDLDGSLWGTWRDGELHLDDGIAVDATSRILHVLLGSASVAMQNHEPDIWITDP